MDRHNIRLASFFARRKFTSPYTRADPEHYEIQVRDTEQTIQSIQGKCDLLVVNLDDLQQSFSWNLREREDVHTYLKQLLYDRGRDLTVLRERYLTLVQKSTDIQDEHERVMGGMHELFYRTQDDLKNTSNSLRSRLQGMSEMFEARTMLTDQFRYLRRAIHEQDEAYWLKINQSEQNAICDMVEKKKQVFDYLTQLASQFRKASRQAQSIHAREMLKQNITLTTDLRVMSDQTLVVATNNHKLSEKNRLIATDCSMYEEDYKMWQKRLRYFENALETSTNRYNELLAAVEAKSAQIEQQTNHRLHAETTYEEARDKLQRLQEKIKAINTVRSGLTAKNEKSCREIVRSKETRQKCKALLTRVCQMMKISVPSLADHIVSRTSIESFNTLLRHSAAETDNSAMLNATTLSAAADINKSLPHDISLDQAFLEIIMYSHELGTTARHDNPANGVTLYEEGDFEFVGKRRRKTSSSRSAQNSRADELSEHPEQLGSVNAAAQQQLARLASRSPVMQAEQRRLSKETNSA